MAAESDEPIEASAAAEPLRWPDTSRPIINEGGYGIPPGGFPTLGGPPVFDVDPYVDGYRQPRRWPVIAAAVLLLALALVAVWLLWWR